MIKRLAILAFLVSPTVALAAFFMPQTYLPAPSFTPAWQSLRMGGGGLMNNIQASKSDGTIVTSANTYGAYLYKTSGQCSGADQGGWGTTYSAPCWEQLFTQTSAPQSLNQVHLQNQGVLEIDVCNNNTNDAYAWTEGNLYVTTNLKGSAASRSWATTTLATTINGNQGINAGTGPTIACDPANPNIVYAANTTALNVSANGLSGASATFSAVSGVGVTGAIPSLIVFDPTSTTQTCAQFTGSPTCTKHFWVFTSGSGVYETYTGGSSFTLTSLGPTTAGSSCGQGGFCFQMQADPFGNLYAIIGDTHIYKYVPNGTAGGGTWSTQTPGSNHSSISYFALDITAAAIGTMRGVAAWADGCLSYTSNGGTTWSAIGTCTFAATGSQPPWLDVAVAQQNQSLGSGIYFATQGLAFDASGNLWMAAGIGTWEILSANVSQNANWQANMIGIENMVATHIDTPPGLSPVLGVWDRGIWTGINPDIFPGRYWPDHTFQSTFHAINGGWAVDWATATPAALTTWTGSTDLSAASSADNGTSWTVWTNYPTTNNLGGAVAASTSTNWVAVATANSSALTYTTSGAGSAWLTPTITGLSGGITATQGHGFPLAADRVNANTFCLVDGSGQVFASTNSGATWAKNGTIPVGANYNNALKSVPGQAGVFYYSTGNQGGGQTGTTVYKITKTTNECDTVTAVNANIANVWGIGFGAPKPGGNGFPTIYYYGWLSGTLGLYEIDNGGTTVNLLNVPASQQTWPNNSADMVYDVSGDINVYGRVYVGFGGSSYAYIDKQDACPWVNFSNTKTGASFAIGTPVTLQATQSGKVPVTSVSFYIDGVLIGTQSTGSGTPAVFSQSWTPGGSAGSHTLQVAATGNGCSPGPTDTFANFSIPITTH